jgi:hypothetical protein
LFIEICIFNLNDQNDITNRNSCPTFGATSLILLAYTNRFLTLATIVRGLKKHIKKSKRPDFIIKKSINLRLTLIRNMQLAWRIEFVSICFRNATL